MPTKTKSQPTADHALTDTPYATVQRRAQAERDKLAARVAAIDAEIANAETATAQEREAQAAQESALADLAALRDQQTDRYARIQDLTAQLTILCGEAVSTDKAIANAERRATGRTARQWAANRIANYLRWQLAPTLSDLGLPAAPFRRNLVDQPREAMTVTVGA